MLGRIAESASLGHSFRHNALMKWSSEKNPNKKKPPQKTPTQNKTHGWLPQKPGQLSIGTEGREEIPCCRHS